MAYTLHNLSVSFRLTTRMNSGTETQEYDNLQDVDFYVKSFEEVWERGEIWELDALTRDGWARIDGSHNYE